MLGDKSAGNYPSAFLLFWVSFPLIKFLVGNKNSFSEKLQNVK